MNYHVMIDLETMGTRFDCPVVSIGAVRFDIDTGKIADEFYAQIDIEDSFKFARADGSTVKWWMQQEDVARKDAICGKLTLSEALTQLEQFYMDGYPICPFYSVWGNGPTFDISILEYAYGRCLKSPAPWPFWAVRDCRTIRGLVDDQGINFKISEGTQHNALDDARHQAKWVSEGWQRLRAGLTGSSQMSNGSDSIDTLLG